MDQSPSFISRRHVRCFAPIITSILVSVCLMLCAGRASADCTRLPYRTGRNFIAPNGSKGLAQVSLRPSDITLDNLLCLARGFRESHPEWREVVLLFFDSREAAEEYVVGWELAEFARPVPQFSSYERRMRAGYYLDVTKPEQFLSITPFGLNGGPEEFDTRIDLPITTRPHCRYELKDRCLLAADLPGYPNAPLARSGAVTLSGRIGRDGKLASVRVVEAQSVSPESKDLLIQAALANFKTWQLDSAPPEDTVRITYSYVFDPSMSSGPSKVELAPGRVTITGSPFK